MHEHNVTANRIDGPYTSIAEAEAAGFTEVAAPSVYYALSSVFAQDDGVAECYVGRKIPAAGGAFTRVWQYEAAPETYVDETTDANDAGASDWVVFPASEAVGDAVLFGSPVPFASVTLDATGGVAGVNGGALALAYEFWDGVAWTALAGVVDGTTMFTAGATAGQVLSFTQPTTWAPVELGGSGGALYYVRARISAGSYSTNPTYSSGAITADASWTAALSAIEAFAGDEVFYGFAVGTRVKADLTAIAAWAESRFHIFPPQSADADYLAGTAGNVGETLKAAGYKRTLGPLYHLTSSGAANGYADAAWLSSGLGMDLDAPNGRGVWTFRTLEGITYDNVTSTQAGNIYAVNGNIYGRNKGLSFTSKGTTAFGAPYFVDIQTTIDWIKTRIEEDILALFVAQNVVPYTNGGIQMVVAAVKNRLEIGVRNGHFSEDPGNEPTVTAPDVSAVSSADKQSRVLSLSCSAVFAGGVQKLNLTVNLEF